MTYLRYFATTHFCHIFHIGVASASVVRIAPWDCFGDEFWPSFPRWLKKWLTPLTYRKIPKIIPGAFIFQRHFLTGLFLEGLVYGAGKFAFQNRLGEPYSWKEIYHFCFVLLCIQVQAPGVAYIWRGLFSEFYGTPIIQLVRMTWSFLLKKRNTLLSVGIVFFKHTLKFRKYVKIFQIIKILFAMYSKFNT